MTRLSDELMKQLASVDTPTLCNAIEVVADQAYTDGYTGLRMRCLTRPRAVIGYATTVTLTTMKPPTVSPAVSMEQYLEHLSSVPTPRIAMLFDEDDPPGKAAVFGDVMANYHRAMGCVAMVTNGAVRDLSGIERAGVACYAQGLIPSHGYFHFVATGRSVMIGGLTISPEDLLVGDDHGLVRIPVEVAEQIPSAVERIRRREETLISYCQGRTFTQEGFVDLTLQE